MLFIKNGYVKTMVGADMENGAVLIGDDGKILAVGTDLKAPADATVIDVGGRLVTPGCVEAHCHIGVHNSAMRWEGADYNERSDPITPHMRAIDGINPIDETFSLAVSHGVTSACTGPGSANVVGGSFAAIKLVGKRVVYDHQKPGCHEVRVWRKSQGRVWAKRRQNAGDTYGNGGTLAGAAV